MQVRKFEAKTIKDAIELVKYHLGPDAIILSAKDNGKGFGLMGDTSVEVTAAVSENKLAKKQLAERKLDPKSKQKYMSATAKQQKEFIDKSFDQNKRRFNPDIDFTEDEVEAQPAPKPIPKKNNITAPRYIDIDEEGGDLSALEPIPAPKPEVRAASVPTKPLPAKSSSASIMTAPAVDPTFTHQKIISLQNEIQHLQAMLAKFQKVPQNFLSLHPGAEDGLPFELSFVFKKLTDAGMNHENVVSILKIANEVLPAEQKKKKAFIDGWVIKFLLDRMKITEKPFKNKLHVFVGPTGQGKTSSLVKMACHLLLKEKKRIAILSGDHVKVGAPDQLKIYSQILNVPCGFVTGPQDWATIDQVFTKVDYVLLDTPGVNLKGTQDLDTLRNILPTHFRDTSVHYVQSIMARDADAFEIAERFRVIGYDDVIFTRLDEAVQHGLIYNFQKKFDVPLHSFGIGNTIPDDYELATKERVIDLIFSLTKIRKERGTP